MDLIVNGEPKHVVGKQLHLVLDELGCSGKHFVVELNGEILSKEAYTTTKLTAADIVWQAHPDFICAVSEITESDNIQNTVYELMNGYSRIR